MKKSLPTALVLICFVLVGLLYLSAPQTASDSTAQTAEFSISNPKSYSEALAEIQDPEKKGILQLGGILDSQWFSGAKHERRNRLLAL